MKPSKYETYQEAHEAVQKLNITSVNIYKKRYKEDPLLPMNPAAIYDNKGWINWTLFFGKEERFFFETYEDARKAVSELNIQKQQEYSKRYFEHPLLPSKPEDKYKGKGWINWPSFFGREVKNTYKTYKEARKSVLRLGITTTNEYKIRYKEDPRLPSTPHIKYKDKGWVSTNVFFGKIEKKIYKSYSEAKQAVSLLGVKSQADYKKKYKKNSHLPSNPDFLYKNKGWVNWFVFLGKEIQNPYDTYESAQEAVFKLGISTKLEYQKFYTQDLKLPVYPPSTYKNRGWISWAEFFGRKTKIPYETYQQASEATRKLGITDQKEYYSRYKEDEKLPCHPSKIFKNSGWISWREFFGNEILTYSDAVQFVSSNYTGITIPDYSQLPLRELKLPHFPSQEYDEFYDWRNYTGAIYSDPLDALKLINKMEGIVIDKTYYSSLQKLYSSLPYDPVTYYGFSSFSDFINFNLEKLWNAQKVKAYCDEHKIKSRDEYDLAAKKSPYLSKNLKNISGFTTIFDLLYKPSVFDVFEDDNYFDWVKVADKWIDTVSGALSKKRFLIKSFYLHFLKDLPPSPQTSCSKTHPFPDINPWVKSLSETSKNISSVNLLENFFNFIIEHCCSVRDDETGELITLEGYINPISKADIVVKFSDKSAPAESTKQALPFRYINKARHFIVPQNTAKTINSFSSLYDRLLDKTELYNNKVEWFEVGAELIDKSDPDCVWKKEDGKVYMWSPVRIIATYTQLFMPFRGSQICWLDSGEADKKILSEVDGKFIWQDNVLLKNYRVPSKVHQGFLIPRDSQTGIGAHVNTNKTAKNAHDGYTVPWVDERIIPWMIRLRNWQTKYNPIEESSLWSELGRNDKSEDDFDKYGYNGRTCFLFRDPTRPVLQRFRPLTQSKLSDGFTALLYLIQEDVLPLACLKNGFKPTSISNFSAYFSLHSMRVSLITAFIRDAKIAPEIVQKLVGHSSIVMTIYYTKVQDEEIREVLENAESFIIKNQEKRLQQLIRQRKMEEVKSELIGADGELIGAIFDGPSAAFSFMDSGICPVGRTRCDDGGEPINANKKLYAPVTAGYLGRSNCIQCRHFATGPAFLGGLQLLSNEISLECKASAATMEALSEKVEMLEDAQYQAKKANQVFTNSHELSLATSHYEQETTRFDSLSCDLISTIRLFLNSVNLLNKKMKSKKIDDGYSLVIQDENNSIEAQVSEVSDFIHLDMVCQSASYFQSSRPKNATLARTQILDLFAKKNGLSPNMFALSEQQQLAIGNEMTQMLRARLGTWDKVDQLMSKDSDISLSDLGIKHDEKDELRMLFDGHSLQENKLEAPKSDMKLVSNNE